jgi:hypothetical protein
VELEVALEVALDPGDQLARREWLDQVVEQRIDQLEQPQLVAMDGLEIRAAQGGVGRRQCVLGRPEHQRQRGPELVADVGEERGLDAVDLGERLGPLALLLQRAPVADRGDHLRRGELEERAIAGVEHPVRADPTDQHAVRVGLVGRRQRQRDRLARRLGPRAARQRIAAVSEVGHQRDLAVRSDLPERPRAAVRRELDLGRRGQRERGAVEPDVRDPAGARAGVVEQVEQRERYVPRVVRQRRAAASHAASAVLASAALRAPSSRSVRSWRSAYFCSVVSVTVASTPPIPVPGTVSSGTGL